MVKGKVEILLVLKRMKGIGDSRLVGFKQGGRDLYLVFNISFNRNAKVGITFRGDTNKILCMSSEQV